MKKAKTLFASSIVALGALGASASFACMGPQFEADSPKPQRCMGGKHNHVEDVDLMEKRMQERFSHRLQKLGDSLSLREDQRLAWDAFKDALLVSANDLTPGVKSHRDLALNMSTMSAPERLRLMEERVASHHASFIKTREAVEAFYAQLDENQKKAFDAKFSPHEGLRENMKQLKERGMMPPMKQRTE